MSAGLAASATTDTTNAGNISSGVLASAQGGAGSVSGVLKANGSGVVSAAVAGTDYVAPVGSGAALTGITASQVGAAAASHVGAGGAAHAAFVGDSGAGGTAGFVPAPAAGDAAAVKFLKADGSWAAPSGGGLGSVTSVSIASVNGFAGTVANATTTPALTLTTSVTGVLKGNGTAVSAAVAGTDYLAPSGSGASLTGIAASQISGLAASATTDATNASNITSGTLGAARLPVPTSSTLGGVMALSAVSHKFLTAIGTDGSVTQAQPSASDVSGLAASATTDTTSANNITSGTLAAARGGAGTVSGVLKANGSGVVSAATAGTDYLAPSGSGASLTGITASQVGAAASSHVGAGGTAHAAMVGDSGAGGVAGFVPAPAAGDAAAGKYLKADGTWAAPAGSGSGTVTTMSVVSANGFAGTVANATTTPAVTLTTSETGLWKGNGTAISAATAGTDYLAPSGSGASLTGITASQVSGLAASATTNTTNASNISSGTLAAARLPTPTASTLGGVMSLASASHKFLTAIGTDGSVTQAQPSAGDISGLAASATTDATNAANITSGTLAVAHGGTGATAGGATAANNIGALAIASNLSDVGSAASARTNLGVTGTGSDTTYAYRANNLSDLANAATARTNLGLGTVATQGAGAVALTGGSIDGTTIGAATASSGKFTSLTTTGTNTLSALTTAGVVTTTGSGVLSSVATTGSGNAVLATSPQFGNIGVGAAASGTYALNVVQAGANQAYFGSTGSNSSQILLDNAAGSQITQVNFLDSGTTKWNLGKTAANNFQLYDVAGSKAFLTAATGGALTLGAAQTTSILNGGDVLVNTSTSSGRLSVASVSSGGYAISVQGAANGGSYYFQEFKLGTGSQVGSISSNGSTTNYATTSDKRLKENVQPVANSAALIDAMTPVTYDWAFLAGKPSGMGFLAQDLCAIFPDAVSKGDAGVVDEEGHVVQQWGIDYSKLVPIAIAEIKALRARVATNEADVAAIKTKLGI